MMTRVTINKSQHVQSKSALQASSLSPIHSSSTPAHFSQLSYVTPLVCLSLAASQPASFNRTIPHPTNIVDF